MSHPSYFSDYRYACISDEAKEPDPEPVTPRKPAGVPKMALPGMGGAGMGLGGSNLLAELAKKRDAMEKRASTGKNFVSIVHSWH
jgi:hypothetical protein